MMVLSWRFEINIRLILAVLKYPHMSDSTERSDKRVHSLKITSKYSLSLAEIKLKSVEQMRRSRIGEPIGLDRFLGDSVSAILWVRSGAKPIA